VSSAFSERQDEGGRGVSEQKTGDFGQSRLGNFRGLYNRESTLIVENFAAVAANGAEPAGGIASGASAPRHHRDVSELPRVAGPV
jgi:hypothetical protein